MNIHPTAPTDPDAFLRWNEGREGKRELVNGRVIEMMTGASRGHAILVSELAALFRASIDRSKFLVLTSDLGVRTPAGIRYPDVVIETKGGSNRDLAATGPILIAEVLSPSSLAREMVEKSAEYTALPALLNYLVLAQEEPRVWIWSRHTDRWSGPEMTEGTDGVIELRLLQISLPLQLLYTDLLAG
jgi:Uma2 family endonuclease